MSSKMQAHLVRVALKMAAEAGLRVWSVTTDGTISGKKYDLSFFHYGSTTRSSVVPGAKLSIECM